MKGWVSSVGQELDHLLLTEGRRNLEKIVKNKSHKYKINLRMGCRGKDDSLCLNFLPQNIYLHILNTFPSLSSSFPLLPLGGCLKRLTPPFSHKVQIFEKGLQES